MTPRIVATGLAVGIVLAMGCSVGWSTDSRPPPTPTVTIDLAETAKAIDLLRAGTEFVDQTSFRSDADIAGQIITLTHTDNVRRRANATISAYGKRTEIRMIDNDVYMRTTMGLAGVGDGWMTLDPAKVPAGFAMSFAPPKNDPGGSARLINAIVSAQVSGVDITGTLDATRVGTGNGISFRPGPNGNFPAGAQALPFQATLDSQGRLLAFIIPASDVFPSASLRYSDFGSVVDVSPPRDAVPAPDALYPQLGLQ
jgi:hypothetical protein